MIRPAPSTATDGGFTFEDRPAGTGIVPYTVRFAGDVRHDPAETTASATVQK